MSGSKRARDRATEAFRRWARAGCPGIDEIRDGGGDADLFACAAVFDALKHGRHRKNFPAEEIELAVREVYMYDPRRKVGSREIGARVKRFAFCICTDISAVYKWLAVARRMWTDIRDKSGK